MCVTSFLCICGMWTIFVENKRIVVYYRKIVVIVRFL